MFAGLEDNRVFVFSAIAVLLAIGYALTPFLDKYTRLQNTVVMEAGLTNKRAALILVLKQLCFAAIIVGASWVMGGIFFQIFAGGLLLSQLVGIMLGLQNVFYLYGLSLPGAATGSVKFSQEFGYRNLAMRMLAAGVLMLGLFAIFGKLQLLGACIFIFSTSLGYMRRSWQAKRTAEMPDP